MSNIIRHLRKFVTKTTFAAVLMPILMGSGSAFGACLTPNNVALDVNFPDYALWKTIATEMQQCGNVTPRFGFDAASVGVDPTNPDKALGALVGISNASLHRLSKQNLLRPLDELVEAHKDKLHERQLIRIDGKIVAIAVAANTKALVLHKDLFEQEKIRIPENYDNLFVAADRLKGSKLYTHSLSLAFKGGWNLTQEFVDQYISSGGKLTNEANQPVISNESGVTVLERMKKLAGYLPDTYLEADTARVLDDLLKFRTPMSVIWVSSVGPLENPAVSRVAGKMVVLPAPSVNIGGKPASTLWWDGFAIPVSATKEQAEAAFKTALEGLDAEMLEKHRDEAFWMLKDYQPGRLTKELLAAVDNGMIYYPASEANDLLRRALSPNIVDFMEGKVSAAAALGQAEADYLRAARERGLLGS